MAIILTAALISTNFWIINQINVAYRLSFLLLLVFCIFERNAQRSLISKYGIWLIVSNCIFTLLWIVGYGDRIFITFLAMVRNTLFFMAGYSVIRSFASRPMNLGRLIILPVLLSDTFFALRYLNAMVGREFITRRVAVDLAAVEMAVDSANFSVANSLILHYPNQILLLFLTFFLFQDKNRIVKIIALISTGILVMQAIFSLWTAPIIMLVVGVGVCFVILLRTQQFSTTIKIRCMICLIIILTIAVAVFSVQTKRSGGAGQRTYDRTIGFLQAIINLSIEEMDAFTGGRIWRAQLSLNSFFKKPFFGQGDYWRSNKLGGHSFWIDTLQRFGIFGALPLIIFSFGAFWLSWRNALSVRSDLLDMVNLLVIAVWCISAFLNPYFHGRVGYFVFMCIGIVVGRHDLRRYTRPDRCLKGRQINHSHQLLAEKNRHK